MTASGDTLAIRDLVQTLEARIALPPDVGPRMAEEPPTRGGGVILGRVVDDATGLGIQGVRLTAYRESGSAAESDQSGSDGYYSIGGLSPGTYRVRARESGFVGELWMDIVCHPFCDPRLGDPITVANGSPVEGIDFSLTRTGSISGLLVEDESGLAVDGYIEVWSDDGSFYTSERDWGNYRVSDLAPGTYFVSTDNSDGYVDELFDDLPCENGPPGGCDPTTGTPVVVESEQETEAIDFRLQYTENGAITGTVTSSLTGLPIPSHYIVITAYDEKGTAVASSEPAGGDYRLNGLATASFFVRARSYEGYSSELWQEIPCEEPCDPVLGTPVEVVDGQTTEGIHFTLDPPGMIEGTVTDSSGVPLFDVWVRLSGPSSASERTDVDGRFGFYEIKPGTDHFDRAQSNFHLDELFDGFLCEPTCEPTLGTPIIVKPNQTSSGINLSLKPSGQIRGTVASEVTGTRLGGSSITLYTDQGIEASDTDANDNGEYQFLDLIPGFYFLEASQDQFATQLFEDIDCSVGCDPATGTPVEVGFGASSEANFSLSRLARVTGRLTSVFTGQGLFNCRVEVLPTSGGPARSRYSGGDGTYSFGTLLAGSYLVRALDCGGLAGRLYDDVYCPGGLCDLNSGTQVSVSLNEIAADIDLSLGPLILFIDGFESGDLKNWSSMVPE